MNKQDSTQELLELNQELEEEIREREQIQQILIERAPLMFLWFYFQFSPKSIVFANPKY